MLARSCVLRQASRWIVPGASATPTVRSASWGGCPSCLTAIVSTNYLTSTGMTDRLLTGDPLENDGDQSPGQRRQGDHEPGWPFPECQKAECGYAQGKVRRGLYGGRPDRVV